MLVVCAWCGKHISSNSGREDSISHGICSECSSALFSSSPEDIEHILDRFSYPVLIVNPEGEVETANQAALSLLGKVRDEVRHKLGGNVFSCVHSVKPEGCGKTIHCKACTIRRTVEQVMNTGIPVYNVPATLEVMDDADECDIACLISAERAGELVLLTIEDFKVTG